MGSEFNILDMAYCDTVVDYSITFSEFMPKFLYK